MRIEKLLTIILIIGAILVGKNMLSGPTDMTGISDPVQTTLGYTETVTIEGKKEQIELKLLEQYKIEAVVKGKEKYTLDEPSQISKYDLLLVWGDMAKPDVDSVMHYTQSGRWYYYSYPKESPVTGDYISTHSANTHIVHANKDILKKIEKIKVNDHVTLEGYLVEAMFGNSPWTSSLSRHDTGDGSCEILYVTDVTIH